MLAINLYSIVVLDSFYVVVVNIMFLLSLFIINNKYV